MQELCITVPHNLTMVVLAIFIGRPEEVKTPSTALVKLRLESGLNRGSTVYTMTDRQVEGFACQ